MADLTEATDRELLEALRGRGFILSKWVLGDAASAVDHLVDNEELPELTEEQRAAVSAALFASVERGLEDVLGGRGNDYIADHLSINMTEILAEAKVEVPTAPKV